MQPHSATWLSVGAAVAAALAGCGRDLGPGPAEVSLTVWNRSQFELLDLRVHKGLDYTTAASELSEPLAVDAQLTLAAFANRSHLTVVRRRVDVGETMALTTAAPLSLPRSGYALEVFDESFRLIAPQSTEDANPDGSITHSGG